MISTKIIVQIDATGLDATVNVNFLQSNLSDVNKASLMKDSSKVDIKITLAAGNSNTQVLIDTWEGLFGYVQIDEDTATTGTIVVTTLFEGDS